mgnify:CR=1 FL=1
MSTIDVDKREQYPGFDVPELKTPLADASVKGITFSLGDLNVTTEMSKIPLFHAQDLAALADTDGTIELVWRLSDIKIPNHKGSAPLAIRMGPTNGTITKIISM